MPPPKTYNYTTNDVVMSAGNKKVFLDFRDSSGKFVPSFRENNIPYQSYAMKKFHMAKLRSDVESIGFNGAEFHFDGFQDFAEWITKQKFYGYPDYELDKDVLHDNAILRYSQETCCLIPRSLNAMITKRKPGETGVSGVYFRPDRKTYECSVKYTLFGSDNQCNKFIGRFGTAEECQEHYIREKTNLIRGVVAESFKEHVDVKVYEKLKQWTVRTE